MDVLDVPDRPAGRADGRGEKGESRWKRVWWYLLFNGDRDGRISVGICRGVLTTTMIAQTGSTRLLEKGKYYFGIYGTATGDGGGRWRVAMQNVELCDARISMNKARGSLGTPVQL